MKKLILPCIVGLALVGLSACATDATHSTTTTTQQTTTTVPGPTTTTTTDTQAK